jgi:hypothetical protein
MLPLSAALLGHSAAVQAQPYAAVERLRRRAAAAGSLNAFPRRGLSLPTHRSRRVVRPSPDLLYLSCVFDVSVVPILIQGAFPEGYELLHYRSVLSSSSSCTPPPHTHTHTHTPSPEVASGLLRYPHPPPSSL